MIEYSLPPARLNDTLELDGPKWRTPLIDVPARAIGDTRLHHSSYDVGWYPMEGVGGYDYYRVRRGRLPLTRLQVRGRGRGGWQDWMIDDPLHWYGMAEKVEDLNPGSVLVAGLGLGLMLHHMARRDDLTEIVVVEVNQRVIDLVRPTLPEDQRVTIVCDDFYDYLTRTYGSVFQPIFTKVHPNSVLWDLAVGTDEETRFDFVKAQALVGVTLPQTDLFCFGTVRRGPITRPVISSV